MDLVYMDSNCTELGYLKNYSFDLDCGKENDFEIIVGKYNHVLDHNFRIYIENTEYGGIVDHIKSDTSKSKIYYSGRTWRGLLASKRIKPLAGDDYYIVNGDANAIIQQIINYVDLGSVFIADVQLSVQIVNYSFERYVNVLEGINAMLQEYNLRLKIRYWTGMVVLSAEEVVDHSSEIEFSSDGLVNFVAKDNRNMVNHMICLGAGELSARETIDLFVKEDGSVGTEQYYFGIDEVVGLYDNASVESSAELVNEGTEELKKSSNSKEIDINVEDMELELGDIIAGREEVTGIYVSKKIVQKIVRVKNNILKIEYKVGD